MPFFFCGLEHFENRPLQHDKTSMLKFQILGKLFALLRLFVIISKFQVVEYLRMTQWSTREAFEQVVRRSFLPGDRF